MINQGRRISSNEIKPILLDALYAFHSICEENALRYSIAFGTMLGAVRHQGFIPWDDDIDVFMPRLDYEKLLKYLNRDKKYPRYKVVSTETTKGYASVLPKFIDTQTVLIQNTEARLKNRSYELGLYLDIFVLDEIPEDSSKCNKLFKRYNQYEKIWSFFYFVPSGRHPRVIEWIRHIANKSNFAPIIARYIDNCAKNEGCGDNKLYANLLQSGGKRAKHVVSDYEFDHMITLNFERQKVFCLSEYDKFLTNWYGDYMKLPPKSQQVSNHTYTVYWK